MSSESEAVRGGHRSPDDDFFCVKYQVWYPMTDCNYRVIHSTYEGCVDCFQGRVNLRRTRAPARASVPGGGSLIPFPIRRADSPRRRRAPGVGES